MESSLGGRLKQLRREKVLSQGGLAAGLVNASYISLIESDMRVPSPDVLEELARRLETSVQYLLTGEQPHDLQEDQLRIQFAEIALTNGEADEAQAGFRALTSRPRSEVRLPALWGLARAEELRGNHLAAAAILEELVAPARAGVLGSQPLMHVHIARCRLYQRAGDLARSVDIGEQALAEIREMGLQDTEYGIKLGSTLVSAYMWRGDTLSAQVLADQLIAGAERLADRNALGAVYWNACVVAEARGDLTLALSLAERTLALIAEASEVMTVACMRVTYAWLLLRCAPPRLEEAEAQLTRAHEVLLEIDGRGPNLQNCETEMARMALLRGDLGGALQRVEHAIGLDLGTAAPNQDARTLRGLILIRLGQVQEGMAAISDAAARLEDAGSRQEAAQTWRALAETLLQCGERDAAITALLRAADCVGVRTPVIAVPQSAGLLTSDGPEVRATSQGIY